MSGLRPLEGFKKKCTAFLLKDFNVCSCVLKLFPCSFPLCLPLENLPKYHQMPKEYPQNTPRNHPQETPPNTSKNWRKTNRNFKKAYKSLRKTYCKACKAFRSATVVPRIRTWIVYNYVPYSVFLWDRIIKLPWADETLQFGWADVHYLFALVRCLPRVTRTFSQPSGRP